MKKYFTIILTLLLLAAIVLPVPFVSAADKNGAGMYVNLEGEWNFKLYRTYNRMFQYFPYDMVSVTWEDNSAALLPEQNTWSTWEKVIIPYDSPATGGLLPTTRNDGSKFFPSWSEAWLSRGFELPSDFTTAQTVTLLLGIIDDNDVVYINGHLVEASGFVDGTGNMTLNIPEVGGFDYKNPDPASQVKFQKSYWEVQREYIIPASILKLGQTNEISIRVYNNNGFGGFYSGKPMAICGNDLAVRAVKGLPTTLVNSHKLGVVVAKQIEAISNGDINLYAETISDNYNNNGINKMGRIAEIQAYLDKYSLINVSDSNVGYYEDNEGNYWYSAKRTMTGVNKTSGAQETIVAGVNMEVCYMLDRSTMYERGNWSRCYPVTYYSKLFNKKLSYSIYLPPEYWENTSKKYPVVYLLHGINSSSSSFINVDRIDKHMDEWIGNGSIADTIVVMPDSGKNAFYKDTPYDAKNPDSTGPWQTHITSEIRNEIETNYRTINDARFRGITGISMGGYGAMTIGTSFPDLYSSVASHMGALNDEALSSLKALTKEQLEKYDFYVDCGLQDTMVDYGGTVRVHEYLESMGMEHGYSLRDGGHNSAFYMAGMPYSMKMHSDHFLANGLYPTDSVGLINNLKEYIVKINLPEGLEIAFIQKLENAIKAKSSGNPEAAINILGAFINQVEAEKGKKLSDVKADYIIGETQKVITSLKK